MANSCEVVLLLGGNMGNRAEFLEQARQEIATHVGAINRASAIYETAAWGVEDQQPYLNQVLCVQTRLSPSELLSVTQQIEGSLGRTRHTRWEARVIDIDTLFYQDLILHTPEISIPHPRLHLRRFTLVPLAEVAPDLVHPELKKTVAELLKQCPDELEVTRFLNQL